MVLRAVWRGAIRDVKSAELTADLNAPPRVSARLRLRHPALVPGGGVLVDQPLASGAVEQAGGLELDLGRGVRRLGPLQHGPQTRTLRTVANVRRARLAHVLLCGIDLGHVYALQKTLENC